MIITALCLRHIEPGYRVSRLTTAVWMLGVSIGLTVTWSILAKNPCVFARKWTGRDVSVARGFVMYASASDQAGVSDAAVSRVLPRMALVSTS